MLSIINNSFPLRVAASASLIKKTGPRSVRRLLSTPPARTRPAAGREAGSGKPPASQGFPASPQRLEQACFRKSPAGTALPASKAAASLASPAAPDAREPAPRTHHRRPRLPAARGSADAKFKPRPGCAEAAGASPERSAALNNGRPGRAPRHRPPAAAADPGRAARRAGPGAGALRVRAPPPRLPPGARTTPRPPHRPRGRARPAPATR